MGLLEKSRRYEVALSALQRPDVDEGVVIKDLKQDMYYAETGDGGVIRTFEQIVATKRDGKITQEK